MKKIFQSFAKAEFSKKLAVVVLFLYIVMAIATAVLKLFNYDIIDVFDYVQYAFVIVLSGYVLKAGAENVTKISVSDLFKKSNESTETISNTESEEGDA